MYVLWHIKVYMMTPLIHKTLIFYWTLFIHPHHAHPQISNVNWRHPSINHCLFAPFKRKCVKLSESSEMLLLVNLPATFRNIVTNYFNFFTFCPRRPHQNEKFQQAFRIPPNNNRQGVRSFLLPLAPGPLCS